MCLGSCAESVSCFDEIMKCSLRFEKMIAERRLSSTSRDMNDAELLNELIGKYNGFKANKALKRWQISDDMKHAMLGVIVGMSPAARELVRNHLDYNKWDESGYFGLLC